jgi:hypothetical protein
MVIRPVSALEQATQEIITLLRDDYPTLISVLGALNEVAGD